MADLPVDNQPPASGTTSAPADALAAEVAAHTGAPLTPDQHAGVQAAVDKAGGDVNAARTTLQSAGVLPQLATAPTSDADMHAIQDINWKPEVGAADPNGTNPPVTDPGFNGTGMWRDPTAGGRSLSSALSSDSGAQAGATSIAAKLGSDAPPSVQFQTIDPDSIERGHAPQVATPQAFVESVKELGKEGAQFGAHFRNDMSEQEKQVFQQWEEKKQQLLSTYNDAKERVGWGEAVSILGQGLAKLAAGLYGMRTGVDTSGIQFSSVDWSHDFARTLDEYKMGVDNLHSQMEPKLQAIQAKRKDYENWQQRMMQAQDQLGHAQLSAGETNARLKNENETNYQNKLFDAVKFNATQGNEAARWQRQFDFDYARLGKEMAQNQSQVARAVWAKDAEDFNKSKTGYAEGLAMLQQAANDPTSKETEKNVQQALKLIGEYTQDPNAAAKAIAETPHKGVLGGLGGSHGYNDYAGIVKQLESAPKRNAPRPVDYMPGGRQWGGVQKMTGVSDLVDPANTQSAPQSQTPAPVTRMITDGPYKGQPAVQGPDGKWRVAPNSSNH